MLAELGAGFDCASTAEVAAVMALGVEPDRIVFANPCKRPNDIKCATEQSCPWLVSRCWLDVPNYSVCAGMLGLRGCVKLNVPASRLTMLCAFLMSNAPLHRQTLC